ncbi:hypothetical protein IscW_ISCW001568 [Ixodes scapularis]|uniref:C2H2-type domain-containing protein n=1 Tax=Ixodes scapularis TaxID=6945 RepID=B7P234_IXOSC|nr:hypothetical protein IscW_ISCW001568 [Ixodes scapularis]|eukprot:XP_002401411.1 hypothetical protein IscW_ISCW001568 [Ixodes scapularis]
MTKKGKVAKAGVKGKPTHGGLRAQSTRGRKAAAPSSPVKRAANALQAKISTRNGSGTNCKSCRRSFATERGLKMHQRRPCKPDNEEAAADVDSDGPKAVAVADASSDSDSDLPLVKSSRRTPKGLALLSCQRCGLSFDPKRDGPRCKHCTREDDEESSEDEDKASGAAARSWQEELYGCPLGGAEPFRLGGLFSFTAGLFAGASPPINAE